ncbi:MAG: response regulator transcription factor [Planctomycetaceae bacterium]|nr:response regulator transcription factor [Planctomycetaceae bacterium]
MYVVDDDRPLRDSLVGLIKAMEFRALGFPSAAAFQRFYRRDSPGCLVLDVRMPGLGGLELYAQLLQEGKRLPVIFITAHADVPTAVAAMKTGAVEFLEKPFEREALRAHLQKGLALDAEWRRHAAEFSALDQRIARLNERDLETLQLILAGASNKVMAARLFISERAVEMRRAAIMRKVEVQSLAELLELAITHRLAAEVAAVRTHSRLL